MGVKLITQWGLQFRRQRAIGLFSNKKYIDLEKKLCFIYKINFWLDDGKPWVESNIL
jgi:hypothetical protein